MSDFTYDPNRDLYVRSDQLFVKQGNKFIPIDEILNNTHTTIIDNGSIIEERQSNLSRSINHNPVAVVPAAKEDKRLEYFKHTTFESFKTHVDANNTAPIQRLSKYIKFFIIHPELAPPTITKAGTGGKVYNPFTDSLISKKSPLYKQLLKLYSLDAETKTLKALTDPPYAFNYASDQLVHKEKATFLKKSSSSMLVGNVIMDSENFQIAKHTSVFNSLANEFVINPSFPIAINNLGDQQFFNLLKPYLQQFTTHKSTVMLYLDIVGVKTNFEFTHRQHLGTYEYEGDSEALEESIKASFSSVINQYFDASFKNRLLKSISLQIITHVDITTRQPILVGGGGGEGEPPNSPSSLVELEGGCHLPDIIPGLKVQTNTYIQWYNNSLLKSIASENNNCLFVLLYDAVRKFKADKTVFSKKIKNSISQTYRSYLGLANEELVPASVLSKLAAHLGINVIFPQAPAYSFTANANAPSITLVIYKNHYFQVISDTNDHEEYVKNLSYALQLSEEEKQDLINGINKIVERRDNGRQDINVIGGELNYSSVAHLYFKFDAMEKLEYILIMTMELTMGDMKRKFIKLCSFKELVAFCFDHPEIKYYNSFNYSFKEYFYLLHYLSSCNDADLDLNKCVLNNTIYSMAIGNSARFIDLSLFIRTSSFDEVSNCLLAANVRLVNDNPFSYLINLNNVFMQYNKQVWSGYGHNIIEFNTISGLAEKIWTSTYPYVDNLTSKKYVYDPIAVQPPHIDIYPMLISAKFGARTMPLIHQFTSKYEMMIEERGGLIENEGKDKNENDVCMMRDFIESKDYLRLLDIDSCYPFIMWSKMYPTGSAIGPCLNDNKYKILTKHIDKNNKSENDSDNNKSDNGDGGRLPMGLYYVKYTPPTNLRIPILLRHQNGIKHDLLPNEGWYIHEEINLAVDCGYTVEIIKYIHWHTSNYVFKSFVEKIYPDKVNNHNNLVLRQIAKDVLNSCSGRLMQKAGDYNDANCTTIDKFLEFVSGNKINTSRFMDNGSIMVTGKTKQNNAQHCIRRPYQLGIFILAYARVYALNLMRLISPDLTEAPFYYHSTDSFVITQNSYEILKAAGYIWNGNGNGNGNKSGSDGVRSENVMDKLGKLDDEKDGMGGRIQYIYSATFYGPNKYRMKYLTADGQIKEKVTLSGVPKNMIEYSSLDSDEHTYSFSTITHNKNVDEILIKEKMRNITITNNLWNEMNFVNGQWYA